jgi:hypothetical protein
MWGLIISGVVGVGDESGVVDEDRKVRAVILGLDRTGQWGQVFSQALNIIPLFFLQYYKLFFS